MKENVSLKFTEKDASAFIKNAKEGTQAYLELDGKNVDVLVKNIDFDPLTKKYMALDFQGSGSKLILQNIYILTIQFQISLGAFFCILDKSGCILLCEFQGNILFHFFSVQNTGDKTVSS